MKKAVDKQKDLSYPIRVAPHKRATTTCLAGHAERHDETSQSNSDNQIEMQP